MRKSSLKFKEFLIRVGVTVGAVVLVIFLAKIWFFNQQGSKKGPLLKSQQPTAGVISWQDAGKYYGKYATVEGTIVATYNSGKVCFLNFHPNYKRYFTAVIFASDFSRFPERPEDYYYGKKVRVSGYIREYQGKPEIILTDPNQIEILK